MPYDNPYAGPGRWHRGNLHTHTTRSDGKLSPEDMVRLYEQKGYDFLALSDHDLAPDPAFRSFDTRLTLIPAYEAGRGPNPHILCVGVEQVFAGSYQEILDGVHARHGLAILCHPNWIREDLWEPEVMARLRHYAGIEVYNHCITEDPGRPLASDDWDRLLTAGRRVWGYANDDAHRPEHAGNAWNMVLSPSASAGDLVHHLARGHFYASTGAAFRSLDCAGDEIRVETTAEAAAVRFIGPGGRVLHEASGRGASCRADGAAYVRVEAEDAGGRMAWSQPFWRSRS